MPLNPKAHIEIPVEKLRDAVKAAYDLTKPEKRGAKGALDDATTDTIVEGSDGWIVASMDYVNGRACQLTVYSDEGDPPRYYLQPSWYEHTDDQFVQLLTKIGVENPQEKIDAAKAEIAQHAETFDTLHKHRLLNPIIRNK